MAFLGLMTVKEHDRIVAKADAVIDDAARLLDREGIRGLSLADQVKNATSLIAELQKDLGNARWCARVGGAAVANNKNPHKHNAAHATPRANPTQKPQAANPPGEDVPTKTPAQS
ncbi:MAG: hypothetical protein VYC29_07135 [Pseudomonadota bacterium]|nr:hypothetical protein [Pseudomonadota bacterium]